MDTSKHPTTHEPHWPAVIALVAAASLNFLLPPALSASTGWTGVAVVAVLATLGGLTPFKWHAALGHATTAVVSLELAYALIRLIVYLPTKDPNRAIDLLEAVLILWSMNIVVFASWYWRLDAGGPHRRRRVVYYGGAFLFPQLTLPSEARHTLGLDHWRPGFVDYLFLAFNTSTAFSPTDAPVLSSWAKILMMIQASISLATLAMVAARAVNIL